MISRFIVVADSHIRFADDDTGTYPSNALMVGRNEFVVDVCNRIDASVVIHLGDIVHPLPAEEAHETVVELAAGIYRQLRHPIHFVPGNHDIGDKPNAFVAVPPVADEYYDTFERTWGKPFHSFELDRLHFVIVDTPVLNSGLEREQRQRAWLEADLAAAAEGGARIFLFTHYPPFLREPGETEHYDNIGEPARSWLLDLVERYRVEAVFSGHVHNFAFNHYRGTEFYVLPSTGFVRPDYSELAAVPPESEGGRDDPAKLGFFVVDVEEEGHTIRPVRTGGAAGPNARLPVPIDTTLRPDWSSPVGVTLRHGWSADVEFPTAGLDEFTRKTVRNDATLPALWEARITRLRIPLADAVRHPDRLAHLAGRGAFFTVVSAGLPEPNTAALLEGIKGVERWEAAIPAGDLEILPDALVRLNLPPQLTLAVGPIAPVGHRSGHVHHFVHAGFGPGDSDLIRTLALADRSVLSELVFRIAPDEEMRSAVEVARQTAATFGLTPVVLVELPRSGEAGVFDDDAAVANVVGDAAAAACAYPEMAVFLDGFMDHDRSYYRRHGLIDRRHNPRTGLYRLIEEAARPRW